MSQNNEDVVMEEPPRFEVPAEKPVEEVIPEKIVEPEVEEEKEKMEVEAVVERRQSQNSETNNEGQENTPIQTDNDEVEFQLCSVFVVICFDKGTSNGTRWRRPRREQ
jgi:hypothetical protein